MIQIINGKRYNTKTAQKIERYRSSWPKSDFKWFEESLYITIRGNYFLAGEGNAMSPYSEACGDMQGAGSGIKPLTEKEALEWCETHEVDDATISEYFDTLVEDA